MITNERQYRITAAQLSRLRKAFEELSSRENPDELTRLSLDALGSEIDVLKSQLAEYDRLREQPHSPIYVSNLSELPGALIKARIARGMSQRALAELLGCKEQQIQRYEATAYSSASLTRLREIASVLGLDMALDMSGARVADNPPADTTNGLDWSRLPIREMYRRHWFVGFQGSLKAAMSESNSLVRDYVQSVVKRPELVLHRKHVRTGGRQDDLALIAWESRVLHLAEETNLQTKFVVDSLTGTRMRELARLSQFDDGPTRVRTALAELGICFIVEPHLPGTYLDGACLLTEGRLVVALTIRHDRTDNFWFVLMHELAHVAKHLGKGRLTSMFDDLDTEASDDVEQEADSLAAEALIPGELWESAIARYIRSPESVVAFANELGISPAIVAGRVRHEADNYLMLGELVGNGRVRRLFSGVGFDA